MNRLEDLVSTEIHAQNHQKKLEDSDTEGSLSSEDEDEVSKDVVGRLYNGKYMYLKIRF